MVTSDSGGVRPRATSRMIWVVSASPMVGSIQATAPSAAARRAKGESLPGPRTMAREPKEVRALTFSGSGTWSSRSASSTTISPAKSPAPSLAASPSVCTGTDISLGVANCRLVGLLSPEATFTITAGPDCTIPAGTPISLSGGALASIGVPALVELNVGVLTFGDDIGSATLTNDLAPGQPLTVKVFPEGLNINVLGTYTLSVLGAVANFTLAAGLGQLVSVCTSPND